MNEKTEPGRPKVNIDWKKVEELLMAGCKGTGIAAYIGISSDTLYERCWADKGISFSQLSQEKSEKGDELLRAHQYAKALGLTDKGDNTLLIWLGKTRLKQMETKHTVLSNDPNNPVPDWVMIQNGTSKDLVIDDKPIDKE